jgi:hypothetical protein
MIDDERRTGHAIANVAGIAMPRGKLTLDQKQKVAGE